MGIEERTPYTYKEGTIELPEEMEAFIREIKGGQRREGFAEFKITLDRGIAIFLPPEAAITVRALKEGDHFDIRPYEQKAKTDPNLRRIQVTREGNTVCSFGVSKENILLV